VWKKVCIILPTFMLVPLQATMTPINNSTNNGAASNHDNDTIKHFDAPRRLHLIFLGIILSVVCKVGQIGKIMTSSNTMWDSNGAASAVVKKLSIREEVDSKILAELLPDLPVELRIEHIHDHTRRNHFEHLASVHLSDTPARAAGRWVEKSPSLAKRAPPELLRCLARERQGICYNDDKNKVENKHMTSRISKLVKGSLHNSRGILKGYDPYVWESDDEAYGVFPPRNGTSELRQALEGRTIIIVGDSLNRQWARALECELKHVYRYDTVDVRYCLTHDFPTPTALDKCFRHVTSRDYVVFNFGHHQDPSKVGVGADWRQVYKALMARALHELKTRLGHLPPSHVMFRTTSVRHFLSRKGEWNTNSSQTGGFEANMDAKWDHYGGNNAVQPIQNLLGISMVGANSSFSIMDVSPLTLARADSTFDGSHFCMPGPIEEWTRMLLYRIVQNERNTTDQI
jgi:hypothetical protein